MRRGTFASRTEAQRAIDEGKVMVRGTPATRASTLVGTDEAISIAPASSRYVSRGGLKLDGALRDLKVPVAERRWLDAGASTGGFTDRLLQGGAAHVVSVDVGYGQLAWSLRQDKRVTVVERTNVRDLTQQDIPGRIDAIVADLSFISLTKVLGVLVELVDPAGDMVLLVKPQFEVGKDSISRSGVVTDPDLWRSALRAVSETADGLGWGTAGVCRSDLKGPAGNTEFFLHLRRGDDSGMEKIDTLVTQVR